LRSETRPSKNTAEVWRVLRLAWPVALAQSATMLMGLVDLMMVGHFSTDSLAAVGIASPLIYGTLIPALGLVLGIEPLIAQAHGARDRPSAARAYQRGLVLALAFSLPVALVWLKAGEILVWLGQEAALAEGAERYMVAQLASIPVFLLDGATRSWLQGREIVRPPLLVLAIANLFNALFNWLFIFGNWGFPALGLVGAGISTTLTRFLAFGGLLLCIRLMRLQRGGWLPWSRAAFNPAALRRILGLGGFIALQTGLEIWAFNASNLIAGRLGPQAIAAHLVVMNMASITFMAVMGVAQATTVRVGNLIGAARPAAAQRSAWVGVGMGAGFMSLAALCFVLGRAVFPHAYTNDLAVVHAATAILPFAAAFQIFDGTQAVCCGVLRGMGRPLPAAAANAIGYWLLALPLGAWLALESGAGLPGLWLGLALGLVVVAGALLLFIARFGPRHAAPLSRRGTLR